MIDIEKVGLLTELDSLRRGWQACEARLAAVEAERDAAQAVLAGAMETAKSLAEERDKAVERSNFFEAGEARAVKALRAVVAAASPHEEDIWTMEGSALRHVHRVLDQYEPTLDNQPSVFDWLTQQRREAAVEALEKLVTDLRQDPWGTTLHDIDSLRSILRARAAALRAGKVPNE